MTRYIPVLNDAVWRKAESNQARRERFRLIKKGTIRTLARIQPQMLLKTATGWSPAIVINGVSV